MQSLQDTRDAMNWINLHSVSKNVHYLILYNLKKPEFIIFGTQYLDNPSF